MKRPVTTEEIELKMRDPDVKSLVHSVAQKYSTVFDHNELESFANTAIWRALAYHVPGKGCKFTSYLVSFLHFEYNNAYAKAAAFKEKHLQIDLVDSGDFAPDEPLYNVVECLEALPLKYRTMFRRRYVDGWSEKKIAKTFKLTPRAVRVRLQKVAKLLRNQYYG